MTEVNAWLREWQPTWQFALLVLLNGLLGVGRLTNQLWQRRLEEARVRREGLDPDDIERGEAR